MKLSTKITSKVEKFQEGGAAPAPEAQAGAPAPAEGGQDPIAQLVQLAQQALSSQDCQAAMAVCDGLLQVLQGAQGGGAEGGAPAGPEQGAPVYRKGGKLAKRVK